MRSISAENLAALPARKLVLADLLWIEVRDRSTGDRVVEGQWSGVGQRGMQVINPRTGGVETRTFYGTYTLTEISDIPLVHNITVQTVTVKMSQINARVEELLRQYDAQQAPVQIFRTLFDPETMQQVAPAMPRFLGFVDKIEIKTPAENEDGGVNLTCKSHTQEMTRFNTDTRSHESQQLRLPGDAFFRDVAVVGDWEHFWGKVNGKLETSPGIKAATKG
ncbi:hypothetical protein X566_15555 [Afipia sp. P52-10]|nr:hypothetical protein [Afipia sp. P52-10]ETR76010.1 hypothetical protein X566_15555 [Afipia sp. P52-10]